jgi:hypothetical protein
VGVGQQAPDLAVCWGLNGNVKPKGHLGLFDGWLQESTDFEGLTD